MGWIKCSERMPEPGEKVLAYFDGHIEDCQFWLTETNPLEWYHVLFDGDSLCYEPTHWQPLPEPPVT